MATVTGLTADRMQEIIDATITDADIIGGHLILTLHDGSSIDTGQVSPTLKGGAFPPVAEDGDLFVRTDQVGDPLYKYTDGVWTKIGGGGIDKVTAFPVAPAPSDGDMVVRTDQVGDPLYKYTDGAWEKQPRMGALTVPAAKAYRTAVQTIPNATWTAINFDAANSVEVFDTDGMHDPATNATRFTVKTPGLYSIVGSIDWVANGVGVRFLAIRKNGAAFPELADTSTPGSATGGAARAQVATQVRLVAGDYIELAAHQTSGGNLDSIIGTAITLTWLGGAGQTIDERGVPAVRATLAGGTQVVPSPGNALVALPTEDFDTDGIHDIATNTTRLTIKTPGLYQVHGFVEIGTNPDTTGTAVNIFKNGALAGPDPFYLGTQSTTVGRVTVQGLLMLAAGDYLELQFVNGATTARTITRSSFSAVMVASGKTVTPFARVRKSASQAIANGAAPDLTGSGVALTWDVEDTDNDTIHDTVTNSDRLVCRTAGIYLIEASVRFAVNNVGARQLMLGKNASVIALGNAAPLSGDVTTLRVTTTIELAAGDYIQAAVYQTSGGALNIDAGSYTWLSMVKVGAPISGNTGIEAIEGVTPLALLNNWAVAPSRPAPAVYKDRGRVYISGAIDGTAATANTAFTLPPGYRPAAPIEPFPVMAINAGTTAAIMVWVQIATSGNVTFFTTAGGSMAGNAAGKTVTLDSINFRL